MTDVLAFYSKTIICVWFLSLLLQFYSLLPFILIGEICKGWANRNGSENKRAKVRAAVGDVPFCRNYFFLSPKLFQDNLYPESENRPTLHIWAFFSIRWETRVYLYHFNLFSGWMIWCKFVIFHLQVIDMSFLPSFYINENQFSK